MSMMKYLFILIGLVTSSHATANPIDADTTLGFKPKTSISVDYIPAENNMYGITIASYHHDRNYASWGFYLGYATSQEQDLDLIAPAEGYTQDNMWRFGLSYSLSQQFSFYGGAVSYTHETNFTTGMSNKMADAVPIWEEESNTDWGAEMGIRYMMDMGLMLGAGYNSATESAVLSIGYAM